MIEKITKGTWAIHGTHEDLRILVEDEQNDTQKQVCHVKCFDHHAANYEESLANAKLIAAAPMMFEALLHVAESGQLSLELHKAVLRVLLDATSSAD